VACRLLCSTAVRLAPILLAVALMVARPAAATVNGVVPLWEQTAVLHRSGGGQIGYGHAQLGLGPVQVGTQPFLDLERTWNLQLKLALLEGGAHRTALVVGGYRLPAAAEMRSLGELHRSGFTNPYDPLWLFPVAVAHSWTVTERVQIHSALTTLFREAADPGQRGTSLGAATMIEALASAHWSARLHAGYWGVGVEPQAHVALSFAYQSEHVMLAAGYGRQASPAGQSQGRLLFDGALLFP
jgi:hypothetical protein